MSKQSTRIMLATAIAAGLLVAIALNRMLTSQPRAEAQGPHDSALIVARGALARGAVLTLNDVSVHTMPASEVPADAFSRPQQVVGRVVKQPIPEGEPILDSALLGAQRTSLLDQRLLEGYRAIGVFIDSRGGIQRFLHPGDRVDVVVTTDAAGIGSSSKLLLQDVEILELPGADAGGKESSSTAESVPVVLAVTPWDAEKLALAMQIGSIQLLARGGADRSLSQTSGVTPDTLLPVHTALPSHLASGVGTTNEPEGSATYRPVEVIKGQERFRERFIVGPEGAHHVEDDRQAAVRPGATTP